MKQDKIPKPISAKKFKSEVIPVILEKFETLQHNICYLHEVIKSAVGDKEEKDPSIYNGLNTLNLNQYGNNPFNRFNLNHYGNGSLIFENLAVQFDIDFLSNLRQSPIIRNELHLSPEIVFFAMFVEENTSEFYSRQFRSYGSKPLRNLFRVFDQFIEYLSACYREYTLGKDSYVITNTNYLDLMVALDNLNKFCMESTKDDWKSNNNVEMVYESYLKQLSSNHGLDTTIIYNLHKLDNENPISRFKIAIHTESYSFQSYIKLFIWSEVQKQWNILLVPTFEQFCLDPTRLTSIQNPDRKYVDKIIKFCIGFSQNFI